MYEYPGVNILILSTREEQTVRILTNIRENYIKCHRVPELRILDPKGGDSSTLLRLKHSKSNVLALPHSMKALTGNPAQFIILDEMGYWDKEDPREIYAQAIARMGDKRDFMLYTISTLNGESIDDPTHPMGYRGSFFHYKWNQPWMRRNDPNKEAASFRFTYHVSPNLVHNIETIKAEILRMPGGSIDLFNELYLAIPRKVVGKAIFGNDFDASSHVLPDSKLMEMLNQDEPLFLCVDPGYRKKVAVLGQIDPNFPRLIYLRAWHATDTTLAQFMDQIKMKLQRTAPGWDVTYFMDVAGKQVNEQTGKTNGEIMAAKLGYMPIMKKQAIEPGIEIMRGFMQRRNAFFISDHPDCRMLVEALETGLVCQERNGVVLGVYRKDGLYEHFGDAARYPVYYLCSGLPPEAVTASGPGIMIAKSPYDFY